jgi:hypothetical protein
MTDKLPSKSFLAFGAASLLFIIGMKIPVGPEFLIGTLLACLIFHLWLRPGKAELGSVAVMAVILTVARFHFGTAIPPRAGLWKYPVTLIGVSSLLIQSAVLPFSGLEFKRRFTAFSSGLACLLFLMFSSVPLLLTARHTPLTFDLYLFAFDRALGFDISFWIGRIVWSSKALLYAVALAYGGLGVDVAIVVGSQMFEQQNGKRNLLLVLGAAGTTGCLLYTIVPATGPLFVFPDFPQHLPAAVVPQLIPVDAIAMRNAVPSLHFSGTLLLYWMAENRPAWVRWTAGAFLALTFIATLALGQHYFVDLVVALPFTMVFIGLSERSYRVAAVAATMLVSWLLVLRFIPLLPLRLGLWTWLPVVLTVALFFALLRRVPGPDCTAAPIVAER